MSKSFDTVKLIRDADDDGTLDQVEVAVANLVNSAPTTLDTLDELAQALNDDPYIANTLNAAIGLRTSNTYIQAQGYGAGDVSNTYIQAQGYGAGDVSNTYLQAQGYGTGDASNNYLTTQLDTKVDETHTGNVSITGTLLVDDNGASGAHTLELKGGGTSTGTPAANEQTLKLAPRNGTTSLSTGVALWGTFDNFPGDTNARRAADIRAGFYSGGGTWGGEYISFNVGNGAGASNDGAVMTTERLIITKDAVTANVDIHDTVSNVRTPRWTSINSNTTISNEGVYYCTNAPTLTFGGGIQGGTIMTFYNNNGSSMTLNRGSFLNTIRLADNTTTNKSSVTLGAYSVATATCFIANNFILITGSDVS